MIEEPVFVVGVQRSGTTVFASLLSHHPELLLTVNGKLLYYLVTWVVRDPYCGSSSHVRLDEVIYGLKRKPILGRVSAGARLIEILESGASKGLFRGHDRNPIEIAREIWSYCYSALGTSERFFGDKYNEYLLQLEEIVRIFPRARFVFVHRDPIAVALSMMTAFRGRTWAPRSLEEGVMKWVHWNRRWIAVRETVPPCQRIEVGYDSLVGDPSRTLSAVFSFLGLDCPNECSRLAEATIRRGAAGSAGLPPAVLWDGIEKRDSSAIETARLLGYAS